MATTIIKETSFGDSHRPLESSKSLSIQEVKNCFVAPYLHYYTRRKVHHFSIFPTTEDNTFHPDCIKENASSPLAPSIKKVISHICSRQDFIVLDFDGVFTKGVFHFSNDLTTSPSSHIMLMIVMMHLKLV